MPFRGLSGRIMALKPANQPALVFLRLGGGRARVDSFHRLPKHEYGNPGRIVRYDHL